jgi:hypothetical protein
MQEYEKTGAMPVLPVVYAGYLRKKHPVKIPLPCIPGHGTRRRGIDVAFPWDFAVSSSR